MATVNVRRIGPPTWNCFYRSGVTEWRTSLPRGAFHVRTTTASSLRRVSIGLSTGQRGSVCRRTLYGPAAAGTATVVWISYQYPCSRLQLNYQTELKSPFSTRTPTECTTRVLATTSTQAATNDPSLLTRITEWLGACWNKFQDLVFIITRGSEVVFRLSPLIVLTPASILAVKWQSYNNNDNADDSTMTVSPNFVSDWTWTYTRTAITALGPAFVKLFQWVATRRDIFPTHVCDRLSVLHDRGIPHTWNDTEIALTSTFGNDYRTKGLIVDPDSMIGCGSAAQVYRGTLVTDDGITHAVAVKVLHPCMRQRVLRDLQFVQIVADLLHSLPFERVKMLNLPRAVANFGSILLRQTDLRIEAHNLSQFRQNFYRTDRDEVDSAISFPRPYPDWTGATVLVEEYVKDAKPISEYLNDSTERGIQIRKELASPLLQAFLKMVFLDNFVHCDLHAGNVLIHSTVVARNRQDWKSFFFRRQSHDDSDTATSYTTKRRIVFLDAGIAMSLSPNDQRNLLDLFRAVILNDGNQAGRLMVERARYERCSQIPGGVDAFASGIEDLVSEFHIRRKDGLTLGAVRIGSLLSRVLDLCRTYGVEIDPSMSSIVISTLVLEGLGRSLEPDLNLMDFAVPFVLGRGRV